MLRFFIAAMALLLVTDVTHANTITDCTAVNDKATASAASGLTTTLSTSGKTCTFTIEGSSTKSSSDTQTFQFGAALKDFARTTVFNPGQVPSDDTFEKLLFTPFFADNVPAEFREPLSDVVQQVYARCLETPISERMEFSIDPNATVPAGCGVITQRETPADITLPGTEGSVQVTPSEPVVVISIQVQGTAFYTIMSLSRLRVEANN
ncbi:MAG: hypothetical protein HY834_20465 [Devosia nanyangense]|uniref:Uncharacterized protein n=1 Tax=Devosia nanyangense TaxID=1228055 RepID=A0A933L846_9HYPH|nr:hypothetical protein [Devosia nanyangense]